MAKATAEHRIMVCPQFVVEYGSQALDHIGAGSATAVGPSNLWCKGDTVPLSTQEPR